MRNRRMKRFALVAAVGLIIVQYGCKDIGVPAKTELELFDIEYWFVNQGDPDIRAVEILSQTYFPKEDISKARSHNYQAPSAFDTLRDTVGVKGYYGCTTQMGIYINKLWESDSIPCWRFYYFAGYDSLDAYEKRIRIFKWPSDTSNAIQEYVDQIGFCKPK